MSDDSDWFHDIIQLELASTTVDGRINVAESVANSIRKAVDYMDHATEGKSPRDDPVAYFDALSEGLSQALAACYMLARMFLHEQQAQRGGT